MNPVSNMGPVGFVLFWGLTVLAATMFFTRGYHLLKLVLLGRSAEAPKRLESRVPTVIGRLILQVCQYKNLTRWNRASVGHLFMVWGFLLFATYYLFFIVIATGFGISDTMEHNRVYAIYAWITDIVAPFIVIGASWAIIRRYVIRPARLSGEQTPEALLILLTVLIHPITHVGKIATQIAAGNPPAGLGIATPIFSTAMSNLYIGSGNIAAWNSFWFWSHWGFVLFVLAIIGYTRYLHMVAGLLNDLFRRGTTKGLPSLMNLDDPRTFGAGRVDNLTRKHLLDSLSCVVCGYCQEICPAASTDKPLSPKLVIQNIKWNLLNQGPLLAKGQAAQVPLIGDAKIGSTSEDALWSCTTCGACMEVCPMYVEHVSEIVEMRRYLVQMEAKFPEELLNVFDNIEQRKNPWGIAPAERTKWATGIEVKPFDADNTEYLFYVGCAGSFDARSKRVSVAVARVLDAAGISWGTLGRGELCCGDSLRRLGNEYIFERLARENLKLFQEKRVRKIITECPHCYNTLKNDYRQFGGTEYEVISHTELIHQLIRSGRLHVNSGQDLGKLVFHDSCYLGRYNGIYKAPRETLAAVTGQLPTEMERHHNRSFCCGAGGGRMWMEEKVGKRINVERVEEALRQDPKTICVCCPYCMTMFEDGLKDKGAVSEVQVLDLAEIVFAALPPHTSGSASKEGVKQPAAL